MSKESTNHFVEKFQIPAWVFNVEEGRITWANTLGLIHWRADSLLELQERNYKADMSESVLIRLNQYLDDCQTQQKTIFDEWTLYPNGSPRTMKMAFCTFDGPGSEHSMLVQVLDDDIKTDPGSLHGIQALLHTSSLISVFDETETLIYANPASRAQFTRSDISLSEYIYTTDDYQTVVSSIDKKEYVQLEAKVNTIEGERWHSLRVQRCLDPCTGAATWLVSATDVTEERVAKLELIRRAYTDSLTGLMNRAAIVTKIDNEIGEDTEQKFSVLFIDIDRFKLINDSLGHRIGDLLLKKIASFLVEVLSISKETARLSGDEFVVMIRTTDLDVIEDQIQRLISELEVPLRIDSCKLRVSLSIGVSRYPYDSQNAEGLLQNADIAMQSAKEAKISYRCFDSELGKSCRKRVSIEADLINALDQEEFVLHYQPKINACDRSVSGVEALVRWIHPDRGVVGPLDFIPVAEETGLIVDIGEWVLRQAIEDQVSWEKLGYKTSVAVNVSPQQFNSQTFPDLVSDILKENSCAAERLNLEVTESTLCIDEALVLEILNGLSDLGITISIDDFGTGYSNLSNLKKYPIDCLKIDRAFVSDPDHSALLMTILELGKLMQLRLVAEGVETMQQVEWLTARQCDEFQGFYFSKPLPYQNLVEYLSKHGFGNQPGLAA